MKRNLTIGIFLLIAFALWTVLIMFVDVQAVGANGSKVGFATFNAWFHTEEQRQFLDNWIRR